MPFALAPGEDPGTEVQRLLWEQTHQSLQALQRDDLLAGVHEARQSCRRARAVLKIARPSLTDDQYRSLKVRFREVTRLLSPIRDATVLHALASGHSISGLVLPSDDQLERAAEHGCAQLQHLLARIEVESPSVTRRAIIKGFRQGYRAARRRMVICRTQPSTEHFHIWRKEVKVLFYQLQLLSPLWPPLLDVLTAEADQLQIDLGRQRDLVLLMGISDVLPSAIQEEVATRQQAAFARGGVLLAAQPRLMDAWLRSLWSQHVQ